MPSLRSAWFKGNNRLEACLHVDSKHVLQGDQGYYVYLIQQALITLEQAAIDTAELATSSYGRSTADAVLRYKQKRSIINPSYQRAADNIVGKMTIAALDAGMVAWEQKFLLLGGGGGLLHGLLLGAPKLRVALPKLVVVTEAADPWSKWADQVVKWHNEHRDPAGGSEKLVAPAGVSPSALTTIYKTAADRAGSGGQIIISVGHGFSFSASEGRVDLGPKQSFMVGGKNAVLVGDPPPSNLPPGTKLVFMHTHVFYDDAPPKPYRSRKADDMDSSSPRAKQRLANWKAYEEISAAFKAKSLGGITLLTCNVGKSREMLKRIAQQWGCPVIGYRRRAVGQEVDGKAHVFLEGTQPDFWIRSGWAAVYPPLYDFETMTP
jgi:hypothetical protein